MRTLDLRTEGDTLVLHFETEGKRINAYTLASTLVALADAAKAANESLNPGYDVEVVVEAIGPGSFRTKIRALYRQHRNLFSQQILLGLIIGVVGNYLSTLMFNSSEVKVEITTDEVIIHSGNDRIIVPRAVYEATEKVKKDPEFVQAVTRTIQAVERDPDVKGIGIVSSFDDPKPELQITREKLHQLASATVTEPDSRVVTETVELQIMKAVLERGARRWEFMWRGVRISAPILHGQFYDLFETHKITIAPGDYLRVRLAIFQHRDAENGVYSNQRYEIVEVFDHIPRVQQHHIPEANSEL